MTKSEISAKMAPSIELLETRLEQGCYLRKQYDHWYLFDKEGEVVASGERLRDIFVNLIWIDC